MAATTTDGPTSTRATLKRNAGRAQYDPAALREILRHQHICHVAYVEAGEPRQIPTLYMIDAGYLYLHGNRQSALMRHMAAGGEVCIGVTIVDGIVVARSGFHCSMNYRSVTLFGTGEAVAGADHRAALDAFVDTLIPGHAGVVRESTEQELAATTVVRVALEEMVAKVRDGDPIDDVRDLDADVWAGVIPVRQVTDTPIPSADLREDIALPGYIRDYRLP